VDCITGVPADRWDERRFYDPDPATPGKTRIRQAGFLRQSLEAFDAQFFGLSQREAAVLDPRQWLTMEVAWEALEDAGLPPASLAGSDVGVFVGSFLDDNTLIRMNPGAAADLDGNLGRAQGQTMLAARLSHLLDLRGPSLAVDTACSASLVATHLGCQSLWRGECSRALVGGVNLILHPAPMVVLDKGGFLSPECRCRAFDHRASGYVRGEGAAIAVLEPLPTALAAGHPIYAVVCATGSNQDGRTPGITVPNLAAQAALIAGLCAQAEVAPGAIQLVEAHGTGTPVGDPIEMRALETVLTRGRAAGQPCLVGSIKTNIGHLEAAAGIAGLLKASLCLARRTVVPSLHFEALNPAIELASADLVIARQCAPLPGPGPHFAVVNSFGYGGTNAAILLRSHEREEGAPAGAAPAAPDRAGPAPLEVGSEPHQVPGPDADSCLVPVSARSPESLRALAARYAEWLAPRLETPLAAIAHSAAVTRDHQRHRAAFVAPSTAVLLDQLRRFGAGEVPGGVATGVVERPGRGLVFLYSGMGAQSWGMAEELARDDGEFRAALAECCEAYRHVAGTSLGALFDGSARHRRGHERGVAMDGPELAQPANFVVQVALTGYLQARGLEPAAVVGHSVGEIAAAWAAGVLDLEDACRIIAARARLLPRLAGTGTMLAVRGDVDGLLPVLERPDRGVVVATRNGPRSCVVAGPRRELDELLPLLGERGATGQFLAVGIPYHHPAIGSLEGEFRELVDDVRPRAPTRPFYSTVDGERREAIPPGAEHWWRNCAGAVRLDRAAARLREDGHDAFLEIGPHPSVGPAVVESFLEAGARAAVFASLRNHRAERRTLLKTQGELYVRGFFVPRPRPVADCRPPLRLPTYAWHRERHAVTVEATRRYLFGTNEHPLLQRRELTPSTTYRSELRVSHLPYLLEHRVGGRVVFPGAGFVEGGLALARAGDLVPLEIADLRLLEMLDPVARPLLHVAIDRDTGRFAFSSAGARDDTSWTLHATGRAVRGSAGVRPARVDVAAVRARCRERLAPTALYGAYAAAGIEYGATFRAIRQLWLGHDEVLAELAIDAEAGDYLVHPALLDGAVQALFAAAAPAVGAVPHVPVRFGRTRLSGPVGPRALLWGTITGRSSAAVVGSLALCTEDGEVRLQADDIRYQPWRRTDLGGGAARLYHQVWEAAAPAAEVAAAPAEPPAPAAAAPSLPWLVYGAPGAGATALVEALAARGLRCVQRALPAGAEDPCAELRGPDELAGIVIVGLPGSEPEPEVEPGSGVVTLDAPDALLAEFAVCHAVCAMDRPPPQLVIVTDRAYRVEPTDPPVVPRQRALWGLGRVLANEASALTCRRIDAAVGGVAATAVAVADELLRAGDEDEVALRPGGRYVHRLATTRGAEPGVPVGVPGGAMVRLETTAAAAGTAGLRFLETERVAPAPDEVECRVWLAGLNFKDVLKAQRRLPDDYLDRSFSQAYLGSEFVGRVERVGAEVRCLAPGDEVYGFARATLATYVRRCLTVPVDGELVWAPSLFPLPPGRTPEECLGLVNFVTAWHCLKALGQLQAGQTVFIHSAAGGVGLAAIQVARRCGARILAAAGTEEKRAYLAGLGLEHVTDSRSLGFADDVRAWTRGRGVDLVLSSATGEGMLRGLEVLAPFGRYVDIGKADILRNSSLALKALDGNRSLSAFDLDLADWEPAMYATLREVAAAFARGELTPLPVRVFPAAEAGEAVRHLGRGLQIGKVAVDMRTATIPAVRAARPASPALVPDGTYLVVGGLGGIGLALAGWLLDHGAAHLVLVGRSGDADPAVRGAVERLQARADVRVVAADAADGAAVQRLLDEARRTGLPLRGVFHLAAVWEDALLGAQSRESFARVFTTKVRSAVLLHDLTRSDPLDHFVLFSSITALVGNPGQGAYAAANAFLDGLAHHRRAQGLPAVAINWGLIRDAGVGARRPELVDLLARRGVEAVTVAEALTVLDHLLFENPVQCAVAAIAWDRFQRASGRLPPRYSRQLARVQGDARSDALRVAFAALRQARGAERQRLAVELFARVVAEVLEVAPERVDPDQSLMDMGLDSLMAVELGVRLGEVSGFKLRAELVTSGSSLRTCAAALVAELDGPAKPPGAPR
jgi:acyl transferase domain-containing protein/NADPH:quinone reductase-like Zn-dependent oxidoreductase/acyl carrier protein